MTGADVVIVGGWRWSDAANQTSIQTARQLATQQRVLYLHSPIEGSVLRNVIVPAEHGKRWQTARVALRRTHITQVTDRLWVAPLGGVSALLPLSYPEISRRLTGALLGRFLRRACQLLAFAEPILWCYWPYHPELLDKLPHSVSVYDCVDDHGAYSRNRGRDRLNASIAAQEARLLARVDQTFVVSPGLLEGRQDHAKRIALVPNGVDLPVVRRALMESTRPPEVASVSHPIIGYAGADIGRIDWGLVRRLAIRNRKWTLLFVGDNWRVDVTMPENVIFVGRRPYDELLRIVREFDVGVIPFVFNRFTRGVSPLKVLDYLATGKPVVSSPLPAVNLLKSDEIPGLLTAPNDAPAWESAISEAMRRFRDTLPISPGVLDGYSTSQRVRRMYEQVEALLRDRSERGGKSAKQP